MAKNIKINGRPIGSNHPPYIIAELSGNHNGDIKKAFALIDAAVETGADAVKLQTYTADTLTIDCHRPEFQIKGGLWDGRSLYELYQEASTPWEWHDALFAYARKCGLHVFSSPFDPTAVDFLEKLDCPAFKIASFEIVDIPLIKKIATTNKPIIISTGVAGYAEIEEACHTAKASDAGFALLHCISDYPARPEQMRLRTINMLNVAFGVPVGLSDHTLGSAVAIAAIAQGACIIEKHMTLKRSDGGPDAAFSLEPDEFKQLVVDCQLAYTALRAPTYDRTTIGDANAQYCRSLYAVAPIKTGEKFTSLNVRSIRPGYGLKPKYLPNILGRVAQRDIAFGEAMSWEMIRA